MPGGGYLDRILAFDLVGKTWSTAGAAIGTGGAVLPREASLGELALDPSDTRAFLVATAGTRVRVFEVTYDRAVPSVREPAAVGIAPAPRFRASVAYSSRIGKLVLFGGAAGAQKDGETVAASAAASAAAMAGGTPYGFLGEVWGFDPTTATWTLLREHAGRGIARANAFMMADGAGFIHLLGGTDEDGPIPMSRAIHMSLLPNADQGWRTTGNAQAMTLQVDGAPFHGVWRPADPPFLALLGRDLRVELAKAAQIVLDANPNLLEVFASSTTSRPNQSGQTAPETSKLTLGLVTGEQYELVVRGRPGAAPVGGVPYTLRAVSVTPRGRHNNLEARPMTRFDASGDKVYVADWDSLDIYRWSAGSLTSVASLSMQAAVDVEVLDGIAYVADFERGLVTVDVTTPDAPVVLDTEWVLGSPDSVAVHDKTVFLGTGIFGVSVVNAADPSNVAWTDQIVVGEGAPEEPPAILPSGFAAASGGGTGAVPVTDVSVAGNHLLISDASRTVWIYAVNAAGSAARMGSYAAGLPVEDTAVHGSTLYVADGHASLEVVDITHPALPSVITVTHGPEWEVSGRYGAEMMVQRTVGGRITVLGVEEIVRHDDDCDDDDDDHGECGDHGCRDHGRGEGCGPRGGDSGGCRRDEDETERDRGRDRHDDRGEGGHGDDDREGPEGRGGGRDRDGPGGGESGGGGGGAHGGRSGP